MIRLAFAIAFLAVFGMVSVWVVSYLERNFGNKKPDIQNPNNNEKQENKTN